MIFTTISNDITGANKSIGILGHSIDDIKKKLYDIQTLGFKHAIFETPTIDRKAVDAYNEAIINGGDYQQALANATKNTNKETLNLIKSANGAVISTEDLTVAQKASTLAAKAQSAAYRLVSVAANMFAMTLAIKGVELAAKAIDHYVNRAKYAAEAMEEAQQKIDDAQSTLKSMSETLSENKDRFLELSEGVDKFSKNLSLSEDDYAEYLSISKKIAEISPSLVSGYDAQGNALLAIGENADETNEKLEKVLENQQKVAQQTLIDNMGAVAEGVDIEVQQTENEIERLKGELAELEKQEILKAPSELFQDLGNNATSFNYRALLDDLGEENLNKVKANILNNITGAIDNATYEQLIFPSDYASKAESIISDFYTQLGYLQNNESAAYINGIKKDIQEQEESIKNSYSKMVPNLLAWVKDTYEYDFLSDEQQKFVDSLIPNLDWKTIKDSTGKEFASSGEYEQYIKENIINPLMSIPDEYQNEINEKFSKLLTIEPNSIDFINFVQDLQDYINGLGLEVPIDLTPILGNEEDNNRLKSKYEDAINRFGKDNSKILEAFFNTKSLNTEKEIDYFNSVTTEAKNATEAIEMYNKATFDASEHSLSDIFALKNSDNNLTDLGKISEEIDNIQTAAKGLKEAMDAYNSTGVISIDQLQAILSYGDKYLKYITDENGNLVLNEEAIKNVARARLEELRAKTLQNLCDNLENIDNEVTAQAYLETQVLETTKAYEDLTVATIEAWRTKQLLKAQNGETDLTVATINKVADTFINQSKAINNAVDSTNISSIFDDVGKASKSTETALDRITKKYKELTDVIGSNVNLIKSQISLLETRGSTVGRGYYDELISQSTEKINVLTEQYNELRKQFLQTDKGTDEWLELNAAILETQDAIIGAKTDIEGFQNSIDKLHWDELDKIADAIGNISDEAKSVVDLLNTDDVLDDNDNLTNDAITALAMYGEQLESAQYLINKYSAEIEYLNGEYTKGNITTEEYNEKMQDLNDKQWESVDAYNAAKKAIIELRKKGIEEEIDALEDLYDARKKAWEQEKDQHDWEKTVSENETNINKLKAQIAELQNDNSLAGIKKRKELEDELAKTESDWEDTLYDHVYDERQDQLDKELDDKKKALEKTLDDEEKLVADSIDLVNQNCSTVLDNLNRLSREYGIQMSNSLTEPFTHGENALSHYSTMFSQANSAFTEQLNYTAMGIYQLQTDADNATVSVINMFNSANGTLLEQLSLVRQSLQEIINKANEAAGALRNAQISNPNTSTTPSIPAPPDSSVTGGVGSVAHDNSGTILPDAGTYPNADRDIKNLQTKAEEIAKDAAEAVKKTEKKKKSVLSGNKEGNSDNKFQISTHLATGTKSATKGWHPMFEEGIEAIEKDGELLVPLSGGEMVFNNEQLRKLWEFSNDPENMAKLSASIYGNMPKFGGNLTPNIPINNTQNVNVEQHFDALVKVEGDMTPDVYKQLATDKRIDSLLEGKTFKYLANAYNTRGYKL